MWKYFGSLPIVYYCIKLFTIQDKIKFSIFLFANAILNNIIKLIICEPRPKMYFFLDYGMPSGHSQNIWFMIAYCFNNIKNIYFKLFSLLFGIVATIQRVKVKRHTWKQVIIGGLIGVILGYIVSNTC